MTKGTEVNTGLSPLEMNRVNVFNILGEIRLRHSWIPKEEMLETYRRIDKVFEDFLAPSEQVAGKANSAFLLHSRLSEQGDTYLDDPGRCFPALQQKYGVNVNLVEELWRLLPPFEVGKATGVLPDGSPVNISLISVPITPGSLGEAKSPGERVRFARPRIESAAELAKRFGAKVIGLGETIAALTNHGISLQEKMPDIKITTGHNFTTAAIFDWAKLLVEKKGKGLSSSNILVVGAHGSIGTAVWQLFAQAGVGSLYLHDVPATQHALEKAVNEFLNLNGNVSVSSGDKNLAEVCQKADIIVSAVPMYNGQGPLIKKEWLKKGQIVIDDSQPPSSETGIWPLIALPEGIEETFNAGIDNSDGSTWACLAETTALISRQSHDLETVGPVTLERVMRSLTILPKLGFRLGAPQSYGQLITI